MSDVASTSEIGVPHDHPELLVLNGKRLGLRIPLRVPLTLIGRSESNDIRISGEEVDEIHCAVTVTSLGLVLRSWNAEHTLVNGQATSAHVLKLNDELQVGPCVFRVLAPVEDHVSLEPAPPEEAVVDLVPLYSNPDAAAEFIVLESATPATEQSATVASVLETRRQRLNTLLHELAEHREAYRLKRDAEKPARERARLVVAKAEQLRREARAERTRAQRLFERLRRRFHDKWKSERDSLRTERDALQRLRLQLEQDQLRHQQLCTHQDARVQDARTRLDTAWRLLTESQQRLLAERKEIESFTVEREKLFTRRAADLAKQEKRLSDQQSKAAERIQALQTEITRLEVRANHSRAVVESLERRRDHRASDPIDRDSDTAVVITGSTPQDATALLADLQHQGRDLARDRRELHSVREEVERQAALVVDQRSVLAEQTTTLLLARQAWHSAQIEILNELEQFAQLNRLRELDQQSRSNELEFAERRLREQVEAMSTLRVRLEEWQSHLISREQELQALHRTNEAIVSEKRDHLSRWESTLSMLCRNWAKQRQHDHEQLQQELARCAELRTRHEHAEAECEEQRAHFLKEATRAAELSLAMEERQADRSTPAAKRRLRVLRRKWEHHFTSFLRNIDSRRLALSVEATTREEQQIELTRQTANLAEQREAILQQQHELDIARLRHERREDETMLTLAQTEDEFGRAIDLLSPIREEVEALTAKMLTADVLPHPALREHPCLVPLSKAA